MTSSNISPGTVWFEDRLAFINDATKLLGEYEKELEQLKKKEKLSQEESDRKNYLEQQIKLLKNELKINISAEAIDLERIKDDYKTYTVGEYVERRVKTKF